jgi:hypothetical protein
MLVSNPDESGDLMYAVSLADLSEEFKPPPSNVRLNKFKVKVYTFSCVAVTFVILFVLAIGGVLRVKPDHR